MTIDQFKGKFAFLSNFYVAPMTYVGFKVTTAEHAFQLAKAIRYCDMLQIANATLPRHAKTIGNNIQLRPDWEEVKDCVMEEVLLIKFSNLNMFQKLLDTKPYELIESNWWNDTYWGMCNGIGKNMLGKLLMKIRDKL